MTVVRFPYSCWTRGTPLTSETVTSISAYSNRASLLTPNKYTRAVSFFSKPASILKAPAQAEFAGNIFFS